MEKEKEEILISFLGMKFQSINPGKRTLIILGMLLIFFLVLVVVAKWNAAHAFSVLPVKTISEKVARTKTIWQDEISP